MNTQEALTYINTNGGRANLIVNLNGKKQLKECFTSRWSDSVFTATTKGIVVFSKNAVFEKYPEYTTPIGEVKMKWKLNDKKIKKWICPCGAEYDGYVTHCRDGCLKNNVTPV